MEVHREIENGQLLIETYRHIEDDNGKNIYDGDIVKINKWIVDKINIDEEGCFGFENVAEALDIESIVLVKRGPNGSKKGRPRILSRRVISDYLSSSQK